VVVVVAARAVFVLVDAAQPPPLAHQKMGAKKTFEKKKTVVRSCKERLEETTIMAGKTNKKPNRQKSISHGDGFFAMGKSLVESLPFCVKVFDAKGNLVFINRHGRKEHALEGWTDAQIRKWDFLECIVPEDRPSVKRAMRHALAGKSTHLELRHSLVHAKGGPCDCTLVPLKSGGRIQGFMASSLDTTQRKRAQEKIEKRNEDLFASKERLEILLKTFPDPMDIVDEHLNVLWANDKLKKTCHQDIVGKKCYQVYRDNKIQCEHCPLKKPIKIGEKKTLIAQQVLGGRTIEISHTAMRFEGKKAILEVFKDVTERTKAEEALKKSEKRYHDIFEGSKDALMLLDSHRFFDCNRTTLKMFGYKTVQEFCMKHPGQVSPPTQPDGTPSDTFANRRIQEAFRRGSITFEWMHRRNNGTLFPATVTLVPFDLEGRRVIQATVQDITQRKKTEDSLRESQRLLRAEQAIAGIGSYVLTIETGLWESSEVLDRILGIDAHHKHTVESWANVLHPEDRNMMTDYFSKEVLGKHHRFDKEYRILRPSDGQTRWVHGYGDLDFGKDGKPAKMIGAIMDITERKRSEEALRTSEQKFRGLYESLHDAFIQVDMAGRLVGFNDPYREMLGYSEAELRKLTYSEITPRKWHAMETKILKGQILKQGYSDVYEKEYIRKDGVTIPVELRTFLLRDSTGSPTGMWATVRDISERKRSQEAIADMARFPNENPDPVMRIASNGSITYANKPGQHFMTPGGIGSKPRFPPELKMAIRKAQRSRRQQETTLTTNQRTYIFTLSPSPSKGEVSLYGHDITERRIAEIAMNASELRYRRLFETAKDGILILDHESGNVVDVNPFLTEILKMPKSSILGQELWQLGFLKDIVQNKANFLELKRKKYIRYEDLPMETADGRKIHVEFISNVYDVGGKNVIQCNIRDITDRWKAEKMLLESETRYRSLFKSMLNGFALHEILCDKKGKPIDYRFLQVNPAFERMTGLKASDIIGKTVLKVMPGTEPSWIEAYGKVALTGKPAHFENYSSELKQHYEVLAYSPKPGTFATLIADVTERKRAEEAFIFSELRYRRLFETAKDGILILDYETGRVVDSNDFLSRILGLPKSNLMGKELWELGFLRDIAQNKANFLELKRKRYIRYEDLPMETVDGRKIHVEFISNVYDVGGKNVIQCNIRDITDRWKAEQEAIRLKEFNERIVKDSPTGIVTTDIDGNITSANPTILKMLGSPNEQATLKFNVLTLKPMVKQGLSPLFRKCLKEAKTAQAYGMPYVSYWGKPSSLSIKVVPLLDTKGKQVGSIALIEDVTERKKAEEEIADWAHIPQENPRPILRINKKAMLMYLNPSSNDLIKGWKPKVGEKLAPALRKAVQPHLHSKTQTEFEIRLGKTLFSCLLVPVPKRGYVNLYFLDITQSKKTEEAIKASGARLKAIFDYSRDAIMTLEPPAWNFTSANATAIEMFGCKGKKDFIQRDPKLYSPEKQPDGRLSDPAMKNMVEKAMNEGSSLFEWTFRRLGGEDFPTSVLLNRVELEGKTFLQATVRDISEQKRIEQTKNDLISLASHQLRTPPTGIKWFASMLLDEDVGKINPQQRSYLKEILFNNQRMIDLVHSLLNVSRIELGTFFINPKLQRVRASKIIDDILDELKPRILEKKLRIIKRKEGNPPVIETDPGLLRIILHNLINNATQYTNTGDRITLGTRRKGSLALLTVSDTGLGIPKSQQPKIFTKFFRADNAALKEAQGTGLGLYITKKIVETMGGSLAFRSTLGKGSTFTLAIPIRFKKQETNNP
jgi:PAS domain S-box-containing protein